MHLTENEEKETIYVEAEASPQKKVEKAADCIGSLEEEEEEHITPQLSFQRWTILDYAKAYKSREITPTTVLKLIFLYVRYLLLLHLHLCCEILCLEFQLR